MQTKQQRVFTHLCARIDPMLGNMPHNSIIVNDTSKICLYFYAPLFSLY